MVAHRPGPNRNEVRLVSEHPTLPFGEPEPPEEWRPVVGYEGLYEVSNLGRVHGLPRKNVPNGHMMRAARNSRGYYTLSLSVEGVKRSHTLHSLVAAAFLGPRPDGLDVLHGDGNPANNAASNLRYGTVSENNYDSVAHGRHINARKTHCNWGHPFDEENTLVNSYGYRACRACRARRDVERRHTPRIRDARNERRRARRAAAREAGNAAKAA